MALEEMSKHRSVLLEEVMTALQPRSDKVYLDGTFGGGGHSRRLLELSAPNGRVVAVDRDPMVAVFAARLEEEFGARFRFENLPYSQVEVLEEEFDGIVLDLGMSTDQLQSSGRGFSHQKKEPLDLRFDDQHGQTAAQFLQQSSAGEMERVFRDYAEDRYAKKLAARIANERRSRPIRTTTDFIEAVGTDNPKVLSPLFQALRIQVNDEFGELKRGLTACAATLKVGGVLSVISFHSLEDRIVKTFFRESGLEPLTKKPVTPSTEEQSQNPASRSAKLRAGRRVESK